MSTLTVKKEALHVSETGWAKAARQLRGKGVRTCVAPVEDRNPSPAAHTSADWNIVRGED
ncbi:hypothetical protein LXH13_02010 [Streptomyces spinosirectus]|uniref:hypothetical protein n=1 Tax=Streptomyces TaxID=1883 RepID=UPI000D332D4D|nr:MULTISPECIES: hypothetical protein [Streptomyces]MBY8339806.1 hypothetical protein [Streptomyces plumbidurans]UIR15873.1 hypothetical protein LXH13_02010 [Streptomyces spinosirectus]